MAEHKELADRFAQQLKELESSGSVENFAKIFSANAELKNMPLEREHRGQKGVEEFWKDYLEAFQSIHSEFHKMEPTEKGAVLEWTSEGQLADGRPFRYDGVSILEFDEDEHVSQFRTYYDSYQFH